MFGFQSGKGATQNFESELNLDGIEFSDADLNDPDLLAELAAMTVEEQPKPAKQKVVKEKPVMETVDVDSILASIPVVEAEEDVHVDFTDEDMNDPHLLAELHAVAGGHIEHTVIESPAKHEEQLQKKESVHQEEPETESADAELSLEYKLKSTNIAVLAQYVQLEKIKALNKKRGGDRVGALDSLKAAKELEKRIQDLQATKTAPLNTFTPTSPVKAQLETPQTPKVEEPLIAKEAVESNQEEHLEFIDTVELEERSLEYKRAALAYKKLNDLDKAREMLAVSRSIQNAIATGAVDFQAPPHPEFPQSSPANTPTKGDAKSPQSTPITSPNIPETPKSVLVNNTPTENDPPAQLTEAPNSSVAESEINTATVGSCDELINHLESTLESQIQLCTRLSAQYFTASEKEKALEFHKRKKALLQDKETLLSFKKIPLNPSALPFSFSYTTLEYVIAQTHTDVALDELELNIIKGMDIIVKDVSEVESGVSFDFGWPFTSAGTNPEGKGETAIKKGTSPGEWPLTVDYVFKKTIKIERTKGFQRFLERKKATFEIMDVSNPRKATGGKVEIKIRMRAPLIKADMVKNTDKWLVLSFGQSNTTAKETVKPPPQKAETPFVQSTPKKDSKEKEPQEKLSVPLAETKASTSVNTSTASLNQDAENEEYIINFLNPDLIASNQVLEHEHGNILKKIAESKTPQEDLLDLKNSYEIKMNMLVTSIQLGALDMPMYLKQVKEAIALSKQQALHFKKIGRMDLASQAMARLKLMTAEVKEVEDSQ
ncbi:Coiled-coil and C2 domain-containing protein 1B [Boothiomyces sp. JEL0838]|nr:Coiled-coil and C2 domain-containing protein 1B [Boothiomyces sp. JEL0838]KAJ3313497.1 Coiled-coil and C2 domain-containing protein 1B [Boothiomyces sp. JEL0838]